MAAPSPDALDGAVRRHDPDRYFAALFAPANVRARLVALYAFHHAIARLGEAVREPMLFEIRRQWWRETVEATAGGTPRRHELSDALALLLGAGLGAGDLVALIDARDADAPGAVVESLAELEAYAAATGGALARLAGRLCGAQDLAPAQAAGTAFALTGLMRALPFHAAHGHCYLPRALLQEAGLTADALYAGRGGENLAPIIVAIASRTHAHLDAVRRAGKAGSDLPALLPAALCAVHLKRLTAPGFDPLRHSAELPQWRMQLTYLSAALRRRVT